MTQPTFNPNFPSHSINGCDRCGPASTEKIMADIPGPVELNLFIAHKNFKTAATAGFWGGIGLAGFGIAATATGMGAIVGVPCIIAGIILAAGSGVAYYKS